MYAVFKHKMVKYGGEIRPAGTAFIINNKDADMLRKIGAEVHQGKAPEEQGTADTGTGTEVHPADDEINEPDPQGNGEEQRG